MMKNAITSDGSLRWKYETGGWVKSSPVLGPDGAVYFGSHDGYLRCLKVAGE